MNGKAKGTRNEHRSMAILEASVEKRSEKLPKAPAQVAALVAYSRIASVPLCQWRSLTSVDDTSRCYIARSRFFPRLYE
jgi:hypothetical protein